MPRKLARRYPGSSGSTQSGRGFVGSALEGPERGFVAAGGRRQLVAVARIARHLRPASCRRCGSARGRRATAGGPNTGSPRPASRAIRNVRSASCARPRRACPSAMGHGVLQPEAADLAVGRQQHFGLRKRAEDFLTPLRQDDARSHLAVELEADPVARDRRRTTSGAGRRRTSRFLLPGRAPGRGEEPQRVVPVDLVDDRPRQCESAIRRVEFGRAKFVAAAQELPVREPGRVDLRREIGVGSRPYRGSSPSRRGCGPGTR